ncbi:MAG: ribulose-phosphate 3-epimerase [Saprospiraceae bacterium]|nr:ribulose-phosphate 3-epimerase [Saprospiraceae bacterium]MCB9327018.1 ribulose-phosphate 3-epimerase [Lewinellaceae bacterium]
MSKQKKLAPSILSADYVNLERDITMIQKAGADLLHLDVMDGHFVPNLTIGPPIIKAIKRIATVPCDVHLMITNPGDYVDAYCDAGADYLTVHVEAATHLHRIIQHIKSRGVKAGISLNPHTPLSSIEEVLGDLDLILIMSVNPGFGGQSFIPNTLDKVRRLNKILEKRGLQHIEIEIDGGAHYDNMAEILEAGADIIVSGSAVFNAENPTEMVHKMKALLAKYS